MSAAPGGGGRRVEFYRHDLGEAEIASLRETFATPFLTLGPRVGAFERRLAAELGLPHAVGVNSCTTGLHLTLRALGVGPGDEVVTTSMTFISSANAALYVGATPVFADVDPATGLVDPAAVERAITPKTKAVVCVHLYGQMCDVRALRALCDAHRIVLVEDAAHGFESERDGLRPGTLGDAAVFSFYATKTMTSGDGGAVVTKNPELDARLRRLRNHGVTKDAAARYGGLYQPWDMIELGYKGALTDIEAAILLPQFDRAAARRAKREARVLHYEERLRKVRGVRLVARSGTSAHHLFTIHVAPSRRDDLVRALGERGVGVAINYQPVHTQTYYRRHLPQPEGSLPHTEAFGASTLSLPLWPDLPLDDVDYVCDAVAASLAPEGGLGRRWRAAMAWATRRPSTASSCPCSTSRTTSPRSSSA